MWQGKPLTLFLIMNKLKEKMPPEKGKAPWHLILTSSFSLFPPFFAPLAKKYNHSMSPQSENILRHQCRIKVN